MYPGCVNSSCRSNQISVLFLFLSFCLFLCFPDAFSLYISLSQSQQSLQNGYLVLQSISKWISKSINGMDTWKRISDQKDLVQIRSVPASTSPLSPPPIPGPFSPRLCLAPAQSIHPMLWPLASMANKNSNHWQNGCLCLHTAKDFCSFHILLALARSIYKFLNSSAFLREEGGLKCFRVDVETAHCVENLSFHAW